MPDLIKIVRNSVGTTLGTLGLISFLFGFEPQVASLNIQGRITEFTFRDYLESSRIQNGNNIGVDIVAYIAYPGAKLGRLVNNSLYNQ